MGNPAAQHLHFSRRVTLAGALSLALAAGLSPLTPQLQNADTSASMSSTQSIQPAALSTAVLTPAQTLAKMTIEQRVGQVLMMGVPATGASSTDLKTLTTYKIGNVFLRDGTTRGSPQPNR